MRLRHLYLILCVAGALLPYSQLVPWVLQHGLDLPLLVQELFANRIGGFFGLDVVVSGFVVLVFVLAEGKRLRVPALWLPAVSIFVVGPSLGLPLFLYMRQLNLDRMAEHPADKTRAALGTDVTSR